MLTLISPVRLAAPKPAADPKEVEKKLDEAIENALPKIEDAIEPVNDLTQGIDLTLRANKATSAKVGQFGQLVHEVGVQIHPFRNHNEMVEAWLGATEFHRFSDSRNPAPMMPALSLKAVSEVCHKQYKLVHMTAPPDWQGHAQAPKFTQVRTDYDKTETVPQSVIYLLEDDQKNHIIVQLNEGHLSVLAHNDQKELVDEFYGKVNTWVGENNFYKNKVLSYNGYLDFHDGLKASKTTWADIALLPGSEELIKANTTDFFANLELYKKNGRFANRNLLMAGPPGTGKSMVNDILMEELKGKVTFIYVTSKSLTGPEAVAGIFDAARQMNPAIVVIEDLDMLGAAGRENSTRRNVLNEMLNQLSGVFDNTALVVMGSTNSVSQFDEAMLGPLRFSTVVPMPLPDVSVRERILQKITSKLAMAPDVNLADLAARTEKFSGAGLTELKELAVQSAIHAGSFASERRVLLRKEDFEKALEVIHLKQQYLEEARKEQVNKPG
ncbi:MAG: ATP-binding protein [Armatimonadetes bacterium]|nr:ATP-binding protein [Armatimonadota bacterium]